MSATFARVMLLPRWWQSDVEQGEHLEGCVQEPTTHGTNNLVSVKTHTQKKIHLHFRRCDISAHLGQETKNNPLWSLREQKGKQKCARTNNLGFEALTAVKLLTVAFWVVTPCSLLGGYMCFRE
jgi:hypothetical protein